MPERRLQRTRDAYREAATAIVVRADPFSEHHANSEDWYEPHMPDGFFWQVCCDCGLTHRVYLRVVDGRVQLRFYRDEVESEKWRAREDWHFPLASVGEVRHVDH